MCICLSTTSPDDRIECIIRQDGKQLPREPVSPPESTVDSIMAALGFAVEEDRALNSKGLRVALLLI